MISHQFCVKLIMLEVKPILRPKWTTKTTIMLLFHSAIYLLQRRKQSCLVWHVRLRLLFTCFVASDLFFHSFHSCSQATWAQGRSGPWESHSLQSSHIKVITMKAAARSKLEQSDSTF